MEPIGSEEFQHFVQSPAQVIQQDKVFATSSSNLSANSNQKIPETEIQQQCLSPLKGPKHKETTSLEKRPGSQQSPQLQLSLKKTQSYNKTKTPARGSQKRSEPNSTKSIKSTSSLSLRKKLSIRGVDIHLLQGEQALSKDQCLMIFDSETRRSGHLLITNYRTMFVQNNKYLLDLPLGYIVIVDRQVEQKPVTWSKIQITTKFGRVYRFRFTNQPEISSTVYRIFKKYTSGVVTTLFAFAFAKQHNIKDIGMGKQEMIEDKVLEGWRMDMIKQYQRMGVTTGEESLFRRVDNGDCKLCLSYPPWFIITKKVKEQTLINCLKVRTRERVPVLSYFHQQTKTKKVSCLWRAAQCKTNNLTNRNFADQEYVKCLALEQNKQKSQMLLVYDIKIKTANQSVFYQNSIIKTITDLLSPLLLRESFAKVATTCQSDASTKWINLIQDSKWYQQIWKLLKYAEEIALKMRNGNPILIQCQDGTDRSAQLSTLAQIILCPYYRTLEGLSVLIDKEFTWLGYPFADRLRSVDEERIPTLIQLLDCIHQLIVYFPLSFQYTSKYLAKLGNALYNNKYGNFLSNNYSEFINKNIRNFTLSFWAQQPQQIQINPYFKESCQFFVYLPLIQPIGFLRIWHQYFYGLSGVRQKDDHYRINPHAQQNTDYLILEHLNVKHQNLQFKLLVQQQKQRIVSLKQELQLY